MYMNKLLIDSREDSNLTKAVIAKAEELSISYSKEWLEIGDYTFNDVCFEAKSSFDFLQSVVNKRLWNQMDNMDRAFTNNLVIVYGSQVEAVASFISYAKTTLPKANQARLLKNKFYGAIGKILLDTDCSIIWVKDEKEAAQIICVVCKMQPIDRDIYNPRLIKQRKISTSDLRIDVLTTIKGVSEKKAKLLIKEYGSLMEIGETTVKELTELDGFGKILAERIYGVFNSEIKQVI